MHGLFDIGMEPVPPHFAIVAPSFSGRTDWKTTDIAGTDIVVTGSIFAQVGVEEGIELQLAIVVV